MSNKSLSGSEVSDFYNEFSSYQKKTGVNIRIKTIYKNLKKLGIKADSKILEIGCGVGTLSGLLSKLAPKGKILATDISPEGIKKAKAFNPNLRNVEFMVSDMTDFSSDLIFDLVVLADVLEHIPVDAHRELFKKIRKHIHTESVIAINIPSPRHIEWIRKFEPQNLQIIDQSLYTDLFLSNIYPNDLYLESLTSYCLYHLEGDYQWIILRPNRSIDLFKKKTKGQLRLQELKSKFI